MPPFFSHFTESVEVTRGRAELAALPPELPILMLPVRLETKYDAKNTALLVRVYPDRVHIDPHDPRLSVDEVAAAATWRDGPRDDEAWLTLVSRVSTPFRAAWLAEQVRVGAELVAHPESGRAPLRARLLPQRWFVVGTSGSNTVFQVAGLPIPAGLRVSPLDGVAESGEGGADALLRQPETRWLVDFDAAVKVGMAVRIPLDREAALVRTKGLSRLVAWGVGAGDRAEALAGVMAGHHYTRGAGFLADGQSTNCPPGAPNPARPDPLELRGREALPERTTPASASTPVDPGPPPPARRTTTRTPPGAEPVRDGRASERVRADPTRRESTGPGGPSGGLLGRGGRATLPDAGDAFTRLHRALGLEQSVAWKWEGASDNTDRLAAAVATVVWPVSLGRTLLLSFDGQRHALLPTETIDAVRDHFVRHVRGGSGLPTIRLGDTPYGLLPVGPLGRAPEGDGALDALARLLLNLLPHWESVADRVARVDPGADDSVDDPAVENAVPLALAQQPWPERFSVRTAQVAEESQPVQTGLDRVLEIAGIAADQRPSARYGPPFLRATYDTTQVYPFKNPLSGGDLSSAPWASIEVGPPNSPSQWADETEGASLLRQMVNHAMAVVRLTPHRLGASGQDEGAKEERAQLDVAVAALAGGGEQVERALAQAIATVGTRLDAWLTSLAAARLEEMRAETPRGVLVGGWSVVHDLPPPGEATVGGWLLAPNLDAASAAAVLRSGHAAHSSSSALSPYAVDLSSSRVRQARALFEGVRNGATLGELLGADLERALQDEGNASLIRPIRESVLAATGRAGEPPNAIVDGLLVARAIAPAELVAQTAMEQRLAGELASRVPSWDSRNASSARSLSEALDALADAALFDVTHATISGDRAAAAAGLAAVDQGEAPPPRLRSLDTPSSGPLVTHRLWLALAPPAADPTARQKGWRSGGSALAFALPRLERLASTLLGDPSSIGVDVDAADGSRSLAPRPLSDLLAIGAAEFCRACATGAIDGLLDAALALEDGGAARAPAARWAEVRALAGATWRVWCGARRPAAEDLPAGAPSVDEQADGAFTSWAAGLRRRLAAAAVALRAGETRSARRVLLEGALGGVAGSTAATAARTAEGLGAELDALGLRLEAARRPADAADCAAVLVAAWPDKVAFGAAPAPVPSGARVVHLIHGVARVRRQTGAFMQAVRAAEALSDAPPLRFAAFQDVPNEPWAATTAPGGHRSSHLVAAVGDAASKASAALVIDDWAERVPAAAVTGGLALQWQSPAAQAPQAMLIVTRPASEQRWGQAVIGDAIDGAFRLTRVRMVDTPQLAEVGQALPHVFFDGHFGTVFPGGMGAVHIRPDGFSVDAFARNEEG